MLNYEQFTNEVAKKVTMKMGDRYTVEISSVLKTNSTSKKGLSIREENTTIAPIIYLEKLFSDFQKGKELDDIANEVLEIYLESQNKEFLDVQTYQDFYVAKNSICYKLINRDMNQTLLKDIPYVPYLDLAIVFFMAVEITDHGVASIQIANDMLDKWNTSVEELYEVSKQNTPRLLPLVFNGLGEFMKKVFPEFESMDVSEKDGLYILTNQYQYMGASCILYDHVLEDIGNRLNGNFYLLPSSTHELLIYPGEELDEEEMKCTIEEINRTYVSQEEVLSNHVYFYDRTTKTLR